MSSRRTFASGANVDCSKTAPMLGLVDLGDLADVFADTFYMPRERRAEDRRIDFVLRFTRLTRLARANRDAAFEQSTFSRPSRPLPLRTYAPSADPVNRRRRLQYLIGWGRGLFDAPRVACARFTPLARPAARSWRAFVCPRVSLVPTPRRGAGSASSGEQGIAARAALERRIALLSTPTSHIRRFPRGLFPMALGRGAGGEPFFGHN